VPSEHAGSYAAVAGWELSNCRGGGDSSKGVSFDGDDRDVGGGVGSGIDVSLQR
jgi:hypothetical protein